MKAGTGRITKIVMEFFKIEGEATLISNEIGRRWVQQLAYKNNVGIQNLAHKKVKSLPFGTAPLTAITIEQSPN